MKKNNYEILILITFSLILVGILINYNLIIFNICEVTKLWLTKLFPSLFPFLTIGSILIKCNISKLFKNPKLQNNGFIIFILALLSGFPSSAKYTKDMFLNGSISLKEADNILGFTFFANPLFLLSILSLIFPFKMVIIIILSHYLANVVIAFFKRKNIASQNFKVNNPVNSLGNIIAQSIKEAMNTMILILGTIAFYNILITLLKTFISNNLIMTTLSGLLEFSQGLNALISLSAPNFLKALLSLMFISFGSLSIHTQIKSIISDTKINYVKFFKYRLWHVLISWFIFLCLFFILSF